MPTTLLFCFSLQQKHIHSLAGPLEFSTEAALINGLFTSKP